MVGIDVRRSGGYITTKWGQQYFFYNFNKMGWTIFLQFQYFYNFKGKSLTGELGESIYNL